MAGSNTVPMFSYPKHNPRQVNLGNTVLVNIGQLRGNTDLWCLGYLQDIAGDEVLVDLDCAQFPAFWISTQYVWYHHLVDFGTSNKYSRRPSPSLHVQVALRSELDGPFVFRPAELLNRPSVGNLHLCCINITATGSAREVLVVHHWQVVQSLPTTEASLFGRLRQTGSLDEIPVLKAIVYTSDDNTSLFPIPSTPSREDQMRWWIWGALGSAGFQRPFSTSTLDHRVFISVGSNSIVFLFFDLHLWQMHWNGNGQREWSLLSEQRFTARIEERLGNYGRQPVPNVQICEGPYATAGGTAAGLDIETKPLVGIIPWELLSEALLYLDFRSQTMTKRVCSVFHWLLKTTSPCVVVDFRSFNEAVLPDAREGCYHGMLLNRAITQKTKVLVLENMQGNSRAGDEISGPIIKLIQNLLSLKETNLLAIMLKNSQLYYEIRERSDDYYYNDFMAHELHHISKLLPLCQKLLLSNFETLISFAVCDCARSYPRRQGSRAEQWDITIPYLEFHRSAGKRESLIRYVAALESHLPPVDEIRAWFKERHQSFVETLPYPDGWEQFRDFLRGHTFTEVSTLDSFWDELDLRNFDQLPLTKMTLLLLDECISMAFENDAD